MYRDWLPQAYMDHHQMGSGNARIVIPPYAEPIRPDGDPLVWREINWFGGHMGTKLEAAGKTGVIGNAIYSGWGHMGFHWITPFHNIAGMLERIGERATRDADVPCIPISCAAACADCRNTVADHHAEPLARRLVARPRHRREPEDRGVVDPRSGGAQPRDAAVEHVSEGHASDRARIDAAGQGLRHRRSISTIR